MDGAEVVTWVFGKTGVDGLWRGINVLEKWGLVISCMTAPRLFGEGVERLNVKLEVAKSWLLRGASWAGTMIRG